MNREELVALYGAKKIEELEAYMEKTGIPATELENVVQKNEEKAKELLFDLYRAETGIRALLIKDYGEVPCCRRNFMYELSNSIGMHQNPLACDSAYPQFLPDHGTVADYLRAADFDLLIRCYMLLPKWELVKFKITPVYDVAAGNLFALCRMKHTLLRGGSCLDGFGQGETYDGHGLPVLDGKVDTGLAGNQANLKRIVENLETLPNKI